MPIICAGFADLDENGDELDVDISNLHANVNFNAVEGNRRGCYNDFLHLIDLAS